MSKIFTSEGLAFLATLQREADKRGYSLEGRFAVDVVVLHALTDADLGNAQTGDAGPLDDDTKRLIARALTNWGRGYSVLAESIVTKVLEEQGLSEFIPPTHGEFDVSFGGITLRLELPLDDHGRPVYSPQAVVDALGEATVTPVTVAAPAPQQASEPVAAE